MDAPNRKRGKAHGSPKSLTIELEARARSALKQWFHEAARDLPWRLSVSGRTWRRDPYATWIAESMLQQTQVETVVNAYRAWMRSFPDLPTLAKASESEVLAHWSGLGYYRRARHLLAAARALVAAGQTQLPATRAALLALPGIGEYTAGAVLSLAYGLPEPLLDGNVQRVASRYHGLDFLPDHAEGKAHYWQAARLWAQDPEPWAVNEGLMELGALVCMPRSPRCEQCPLSLGCHAFREHKTGVLPPAKARPKPSLTPGIALVIARQNQFLLVPQPAGAFLQGHWLFPLIWGEYDDAKVKADLAGWLPRGTRWHWLASEGHVSHTITRHRIELTVRVIEVEGATDRSPQATTTHETLRWVSASEMTKALVPSLGKKIWASYSGLGRGLAQQRKAMARLA